MANQQQPMNWRTCNTNSQQAVSRAQPTAAPTPEPLQHAERLASLGTLAAGVAHELNNPLHAAILSAEHALSLLSRHQSEVSDELQTTLEDIVQEIARCGHIVRTLQRFSGEALTETWPSDLNEIILRFVKLSAQYVGGSAIEFKCHLAPTLPVLRLNPTQIEQALAGLVQNALDHANAEVQVSIRTVFDGTSVQLLVHDNGPGIPPEHLPYVFDPFYSTRRRPGQMGLGLSLVHAIVTAHRGIIRTESAPDGGASFIITLPVNGVEREIHEETADC